MLEAARSWDDRLADALSKEHGETEGHALARRYGALFPDYYKSATPLYMAKFDVGRVREARPRPRIRDRPPERARRAPRT